jgi:CRISPR-associated endonuclease Csn1
LGLTIGHSSIGWAALQLDTDNDSVCGLLDAGVRVFPPGVVGDIDSARDEARNARRQLARQRRVQLRRHVGRLKTVFRLLQGVGLLPPTPSAAAPHRDAVLKGIDAAAGGTSVPYRLRAYALDKPLAAFELGRIIYHIAQRRGFQSNRRRPGDPKVLGPVLGGIAELDKAIAAAGARTLGEYLFKLCQDPARTRIRARYTARRMYRDELERILAVQSPHHPALTAKFGRTLTAEVFKQLPLRSQRARIGRCELEPHKPRMPLAALDAQEFRLLQRVNDLRLVDDVGLCPIDLTVDQRRKIIEIAGAVGDVTFAAIRKALGLPKTVRFNLERVDEKSLVGNRTAARVGKCVGVDAWRLMPEAAKEALVRDLICIEEPAGLLKRLVTAHALPLALAHQLVETPLEPGFLKHSHRAVTRLLPSMRAGVAYATALKQEYPHAVRPEMLAVPVDPLRPPIHHVFPRIPTPMVGRAVAELRVVMRALTSRYGLPVSIRVELHRELCAGRKARETAVIKMRMRQKTRRAAASAITKALNVQDPPPWMIDKVLLADECGWVCPYTGKTIAMRSLCGGAPQFHTAYILPLGRTLDSSFANKTLCHHSALATQARNKPIDAAVIARFEKMGGPFAEEKLRRARMTDQEIEVHYSQEMIAGRFVDGCYAACVAVDYLNRLYPSAGRVTTSRGPVTGYVRDVLGLGHIAPRGDYRQHVVDAVCVALSGPTIVKQLCTSALAATPGGHKRFADVEPPFKGFYVAVRDRVQAAIPSFRWRAKVSGPLHEESYHAPPVVSPDGKKRHHVRKPLATLSQTDVGRIVAPAVRDAVVRALATHGAGAEPRKVFAVPENLPHLPSGCVIRACKVWRPDTMFPVSTGGAQKWVTTEENHHIAVRETPEGTWVRDVCSQFEAQRRLRAGEAVVSPTDDLVGSLIVGAPVALGDKALGDLDARDLRVVRSVGLEPRVAHVGICDSRGLKQIVETGDLGRDNVEKLRRLGCRRVNVDVFGRVSKYGG